MIPHQPLSSLKIPGSSQESSGLSDALNLKPGRIIDAKVLDVQPENRVQLLVLSKSGAGPEHSVEHLAQQTTGSGKAAVLTSSMSSNDFGQQVLAGQKVEVSTQLPLKPGMSITLTVAAGRQGTVLKPVLSSSSATSLDMPSGGTNAELKILAGKQEGPGLSGSDIKPGQTMEAKVSDVTFQNRAVLLVGGQKLSVSTQLPLTRGMQIPMKVVQSGQGIVLKPVSNAVSPSTPGATDVGADPGKGSAVSAQGRALATTLPDTASLLGSQKSFQTTAFQSFSPAKILQGLGALSQAREPVLTDILMGLALKSDVRDDQFLPKIMENMGLSLEKKLLDGLGTAGDNKKIGQVMQQLADQDVKAAALSLSANQTDSEKIQVLKHVTDALDHFAQINVKPGDGGPTQDGARFLLPFPVWTEDGFDFGQIMVDTGKAGTANKDKILSISFLLDMTALGPLRADFSILDKTIAGRFLLENQETCDYLSPKISKLKQGLSGIGYQAGNIECRVARPEQIAPACLMLSMKEPDQMQGLNIVV